MGRAHDEATAGDSGTAHDACFSRRRAVDANCKQRLTVGIGCTSKRRLQRHSILHSGFDDKTHSIVGHSDRQVRRISPEGPRRDRAMHAENASSDPCSAPGRVGTVNPLAAASAGATAPHAPGNGAAAEQEAQWPHRQRASDPRQPRQNRRQHWPACSTCA